MEKFNNQNNQKNSSVHVPWKEQMRKNHLQDET